MAGNREEEWWHHLRIVREVVPSGEKAGREENNEKTEETCGKSDVSGGQNAPVRMRTFTPASPRDPRRILAMAGALSSQGLFSFKPIIA